MIKKHLPLLVFLLLIVSPTAWAQGLLVTGTVISADDGLSLPGVAVQVKGATTGTVTDIDGQYAITVPRDATLRFTGLNYKEQEIPVRGRAVINVILLISMNEVVKRMNDGKGMY